ncbi:excalibur calcium-binding domain-containing protein [Nocardia sp. XZ_19_385]|uniref:excalibur calcium-binding domain-containing protein n=1 Tax=Nocardia sp. XZ_19_385 TaxID=2769488 RepID=UPI002815C089|nr:excalibur calcium-binding domain-containing protein [Nocardia sp. XZ_19_385]
MSITVNPRRAASALGAVCLVAGFGLAPAAAILGPVPATAQAGELRDQDLRPTDKDKPKKQFYSSCAEARADGNWQLRRGEPGYWPYLDRDGDGIACESSER